MARPRCLTYALEQLYEDQSRDFVVDVIAQLLSWLDPGGKDSCHRFTLHQKTRAGAFVARELVLSWNLGMLIEHDPRLDRDLARFRSGHTLTREDQAKYAAYGLAMVATSCLLRRRIVNVAYFRPPDLLLDDSAGALRGVEVAGRTSKGYAALEQVRDGWRGEPGKRAQLIGQKDVVEAYLSLWCREPRVSIWEKVKP